jgi:hypothetical protein
VLSADDDPIARVARLDADQRRARRATASAATRRRRVAALMLLVLSARGAVAERRLRRDAAALGPHEQALCGVITEMVVAVGRTCG